MREFEFFIEINQGPVDMRHEIWEFDMPGASGLLSWMLTTSGVRNI